MRSKKKNILVVGAANRAVPAVLESILGGQDVTIHIVSDREFSVNRMAEDYAAATNANLYGHELREFDNMANIMPENDGSALIAFIDESLSGEQRKVCVELSDRAGKLNIQHREFDFSVLA